MGTAVQDRITDPGFAAAQAATDAAAADLRALGIPADIALTVVRRAYGAGLDRGLYLGLRGRRSDSASGVAPCGTI
jgi:hypothetical protein